MEEEVLPGDLDAGEVIMLSGARHELLVKAVRLGQGGFILTVTPIDDDTPGAEQLITPDRQRRTFANAAKRRRTSRRRPAGCSQRAHSMIF